MEQLISPCLPPPPPPPISSSLSASFNLVEITVETPIKKLKTEDGSPSISQQSSSSSSLFEDIIQSTLHCTALQVIGKGGFGTVYKALDRRTCKAIAFKTISPKFSSSSKTSPPPSATTKVDDNSYTTRIRREVYYLSVLKHANIVAYQDNLLLQDADGAKHAIIQMEYLHETMVSLVDHPVGLTVARRLVEQIGSAVVYMHRQGIVHHDIKLENIMTDRPVNCHLSRLYTRTQLRKCTFKLIDLGLARHYITRPPLEARYNGGTASYCSPEKRFTSTTKTPYDAFLSDAYSLGVALLQCWLGNLELNRAKRELKGKPEFWLTSTKHGTLPFWRQFSTKLLRLKVPIEAVIRQMMAPEADRLSVEEFMKAVAKCK